MSDGNDQYDGGHNPLDGYERFLKSRKSTYKRLDTDALAVEVEGYTLELYWNEDDEALMCQCAFGAPLSLAVRDLAAITIMHINRQHWLGHFELSDDGYPVYRYTMLFHGTAEGMADTEVIEELSEIMTRSCKQYGPAFGLMAAARSIEEFPRLMSDESICEPLGLALIESCGRG